MHRLLACFCLSGLIVAAPVAAENELEPALISLIIDDIGNRLQNDERATRLPGPVACAILPHTPHARHVAELAHALDKEVLVHLPMEAEHNNHLLGPGALLLDMPEQKFQRTLANSIQSVPHAVGISNHMGSLMTRDTQSMALLMRAIQPLGLFYLDSRTSHLSVADSKADRYRVPFLRRDVFLDNIQERDYVIAQFERLIVTARRKGSAIGIGHPHTVTLDVLDDLLPRLEYHGVKLISLREMLAFQTRSRETWQQSLSH